MKLYILSLLAFLSFSVFNSSAQKRQIEYFATQIEFKKDRKIPSFCQFKSSEIIHIDKLEGFLAAIGDWSKSVSLKLLNANSDELGFDHIRYQQTVNNIPVENTMLVVHVKDGMVQSFNGSLISDIHIENLFSKSLLTKEQIIEIAKDEVPSEQYIWETTGNEDESLKEWKQSDDNPFLPKIETVIIEDESTSEYKKVYRVNIISRRPLKGYYVYINQNEGKVLDKIPSICEFDEDGTAVTRYSGTRSIRTTKRSDGVYILKEDGRGNGIETRDYRGNDGGPSYDWEDDDNYWDNDTPEFSRAASEVHWGAEMTYDYLMNEHNINSMDGNGMKINAFVDIGEPGAFYNPGTDYVTFGANDEYTYTAVEIVAHEIGHGVNFNSGGVSRGEGAALNESFSDIIGNTVERYARPNNWSWEVGEDIGGRRHMQNPKSKQHPDTYKGEYWSFSDSRYSNSAIQNHWYYILSEGKEGVNDNNDAYSVEGIGIDNAIRIALRTYRTYLTSNSDHADVRRYSILAASDLYGGCSKEVESVTNAWYAVGVGDEYQTNEAEANFESETNIGCSAPHEVRFINTSSGTDQVLWDFGDGSTSTELNPKHTYTSEGDFTVKLELTGVCGEDDIEKVDFVKIDGSNSCNYNMEENVTTTTTACAGTLYDPGGPDAPYSVETDNYFLITPPNATSVTITFREFSVEPGSRNLCDYDYLSLHDGNSTDSPLMGWYCDNDPPLLNTEIKSSKGEMLIRLFSDDSRVREGFMLEWSCEQTISGIDEQIVSDVTLYPMPAKETLHYNFEQMTANNEMVIYNANGILQKTIYIQESAGVIDVSDLIPGIYFLRLSINNHESLIKQFVIGSK